MRPVHLADIEYAARVLLTKPRDDWNALILAILAQARAADAYRLDMGTPHPAYGVGTVMAAAGRYEAAPRPGAWEGDALAALATVVDALQTAQQYQYP